MILTAILTGLITAALILGGLILILLAVKRRALKVITSFVSQPDEKTPSPLAQAFDQAAAIASARLVLQAKTTFMGLASVDSKNAGKEAMAAAGLANPGMAALLQFIPGVGRRLAKNPELLSFASGLLSKVGGNHAGQSTPQSGGQVKFKL